MNNGVDYDQLACDLRDHPTQVQALLDAAFPQDPPPSRRGYKTSRPLWRALDKHHPDMRARFLAKRFDPHGGDELTSLTLTDLLKDNIPATLLPRHAPAVVALAQRWDAIGGLDQLLNVALERAVSRGDDDELFLLDHVMGAVDVKEARPHVGGEGNVIHLALIKMCDHLPHALTHLPAILALAVQHGATADAPCKTTAAWAVRYCEPSVWAWVGNNVVNGERWAAPVLDHLLDLGLGWGTLDQRQDAAGDQVRAHPAWRRKHLAQAAGGGVEETPRAGAKRTL